MTSATLDNRNSRTALYALLGALFMLGMGYAAVPLYDLFCRVTGFGGTTQRASESDADIAAQAALSAGAKTISVRFDASTARDVPMLLLHHRHGDGEIIPARQLVPACVCQMRSTRAYPPELL